MRRLINERCLDCRKDTVHRFRSHNGKEIQLICTECRAKLVLAFDRSIFAKLRETKEELR